MLGLGGAEAAATSTDMDLSRILGSVAGGGVSFWQKYDQKGDGQITFTNSYKRRQSAKGLPFFILNI